MKRPSLGLAFNIWLATAISLLLLHQLRFQLQFLAAHVPGGLLFALGFAVILGCTTGLLIYRHTARLKEEQIS